jgi:hypothetical protein
MVKYSVRHYAHFECYLEAGKSLRELRDWQVIQFPHRLLKDRGLLDQGMAAYDREMEKVR